MLAKQKLPHRKPCPNMRYVLMYLLVGSNLTTSLQYVPPPVEKNLTSPPQSNFQAQSSSLMISYIQDYISNPDASSLCLSSGGPPSNLETKTQFEQMSDAIALKSVQGTRWRILPTAISKSDIICPSVASFTGFADEPNKGVVKVTQPIATSGSICTTETTKSGRWVTKPYRWVQLSVRWKVGPLIYKGFIQAKKTYGTSGLMVEAEMVGDILDSSRNDKVIGKFQADLLPKIEGTDEDGKAPSLEYL